MKFHPTFCNFFPGPYCAEKIHTSTFVCCLHPGKEARPYTNHKKKIRGRKAKTFCFPKIGFVHSRSKTYCALLLGYFCLKFLPDIIHCVYWVVAEIWAPESSHKIRNKFLIHHCPGWKEGSFVCETVWFFSWVNTHPFDLKSVAFCPKIQWRFLRGILGTKPFRENFSEILFKPRLSSGKTCEISPYFLQFFSGPYCAEKINTSTFVCFLKPGKESRP